MDQGRLEPIQVHGSQRAPLRIARMGRRGRGVVAERRIEAGKLVERSPVLIIPHADRAAVDRTVVFTYLFMWEHGTVEEDLYKHEGRAAIALGFTSLLNQSYGPVNFLPGTARASGWRQTDESHLHTGWSDISASHCGYHPLEIQH